MTNDEIQRTMEFILEQQAQFAASMQRLDEERIREKEQRVRDVSRLARVEESFQLLVQLAQTTDVRLDGIEARTASLETNMAALAAAQAHSEQRLSALIDIVREGRNGKS